jgi:hypothetical protein
MQNGIGPALIVDLALRTLYGLPNLVMPNQIRDAQRLEVDRPHLLN